MKSIVAVTVAVFISVMPICANADSGDFISGMLFYKLFLNKDKKQAKKTEEREAGVSECSPYESCFAYYCSTADKNNFKKREDSAKYFLNAYKTGKDMFPLAVNKLLGQQNEIKKDIEQKAVDYYKECKEPWPELINGVTTQ